MPAERKWYDRPEFVWHRDIGFPGWFNAKPTGVIPIKWTDHALEAAANDRYVQLTVVPTQIDLSTFEVIEMRTDQERPHHPVGLVLRKPWAHGLDSVLALRWHHVTGSWRVTTVWFNMTTDTHGTLDASRYERP